MGISFISFVSHPFIRGDQPPLHTRQIDLVWGLAFPILERIFGYVPAKRFRLGKWVGG